MIIYALIYELCLTITGNVQLVLLVFVISDMIKYQVLEYYGIEMTYLWQDCLRQ